MQRRGLLISCLLLAAALIAFYVQRLAPKAADVAATATSALKSLQAENKLIVFSASLTVMTTGKTKADAFIAQKLVLVQPVLVHYGVDLSKHKLRYDAAAKKLFVSLPDVAIVARDMDPAAKEEISNSGVIGKLTGTEDALRRAAEAQLTPEVMRQAASDTLMALARDSARRQVQSVIGGALGATGSAVEVVVQVGPQPGS
jgi:Protein of unknown function (DUF4230)